MHVNHFDLFAAEDTTHASTVTSNGFIPWAHILLEGVKDADNLGGRITGEDR